MDARASVTKLMAFDGTHVEKTRIMERTAAQAETKCEAADPDDQYNITYWAHVAHYARIEIENMQYKVGDIVEVHRYGKKYYAEVTKVGAKGAAYATFTYGNGATRTVRV